MADKEKIAIGVPYTRVELSQDDFLNSVRGSVYDRLSKSSRFFDSGRIGEDGSVHRILTLPLGTETQLFRIPVVGEAVRAVTIFSSDTPYLGRLTQLQEAGKIDHYGNVLPDGTGESTLIGLPDDIRTLFDFTNTKTE